MPPKLLAIERVRAKRSLYKLTQEQMEQLKEREDTKQSALESGLPAVDTEVWPLKMENGQPTLEKLAIGGRPLKAQGMHERLMELLTDVHGKSWKTLRPQRLLTLLNMGSGSEQRRAVEARVNRTFNVLGLLADKAGETKITVEAQNVSGIDPTWVRNAIKESLSEANVPFQIRESSP